MTLWRTDMLGAGFECTDLDLGSDNEGRLLATLVRSLPSPLGFWDRLLGRERDFEQIDVLYVHGWSDYFFQAPMAQDFTSRGARFFALDLRKYGRSLREGQTPGFIERLSDYDREIGMAIDLIRADAAPDRSLVLLGHSTGGLILSLWSARNPGIASAIVLNSPWLEIQLSSVARKAVAPIVNASARYRPHDLAAPQLDLGFYSQAQQVYASRKAWDAINTNWRPRQTMPVRAAWLNAIIDGQDEVSRGIEVGAPACVLLSARSRLGLVWDERMLHADSVLEVEGVARAALKLGSSVTVERIDGALHDVFLSDEPVSQNAYERMNSWILGCLYARDSLKPAVAPGGKH